MIFGEFSQDKLSTKGNIASTGLGLGIGKQIIDRHGGRNLAGRCCFYIELPAGASV